jgi:hypothetical protein
LLPACLTFNDVFQLKVFILHFVSDIHTHPRLVLSKVMFDMTHVVSFTQISIVQISLGAQVPAKL